MKKQSYKEWCKAFDLDENDKMNKYIFKNKGCMGFVFDDFENLKDCNMLSENQIRAVED